MSKFFKKVLKVAKFVAPLAMIALPFAAPALAAASFSAATAGFSSLASGLTSLANVGLSSGFAIASKVGGALKLLGGLSGGEQSKAVSSQVPAITKTANTALLEAEEERKRRSQSVSRAKSVSTALSFSERPSLASRSLLGG